MKKNFILIVLGGTLFMSGCAQQNSQNVSIYQYPFKTAKIEYAIKGTTEGKETLTIKGDKSVGEAHVIFHKPTGDENQDNLLIKTEKYNYSVDLDKKIASMFPNPFYDYLMAVNPSERQMYLKKIAVGMDPNSASTQELKSSGTQTIAGQTCETYQMSGLESAGEMCLWNGIPLKINVSLPTYGFTTDKIATSVQTDIDVPDTAFDVPSGITVKTAGVDATTQQ